MYMLSLVKSRAFKSESELCWTEGDNLANLILQVATKLSTVVSTICV